MEKGEGWRVFTWGGLMTFAFTHAQAQTQTFDSLQVGTTWWWGDLDQWTLAEEDSLWTLDATSDGHGPTTAVFQWDAHLGENQVTPVRHGVMDPLLGEVVFQDETWTIEGRAEWAWDGISSDGQAVGPGTYVVWAQALVDGAWQSVEKCLVAVRGR